MNATATLTKRENEVAELIAWGATKKEIAKQLYLSERTIENHTRNIYGKTGVTKVNELSAWWFCRSFKISFDLSPIHRIIIAIVLLSIVITDEVINSMASAYLLKAKKTESVRKASKRKDESHFNFIDFFDL